MNDEWHFWRQNPLEPIDIALIPLWLQAYCTHCGMLVSVSTIYALVLIGGLSYIITYFLHASHSMKNVIGTAKTLEIQDI